MITELSGLEALIGVGILSIAAVLVILAIVPPAVAYKYYTKRKWKPAIMFAIWYLIASILIGFGLSILSINLGILQSLVKLILAVFVVTRLFKKAKVKSEWKLIMWIIVANVVILGIILLILGAIWIPLFLEVLGASTA
jgi:hypothetical protein